MEETGTSTFVKNDDLERLLELHHTPAAYRQSTCELVSPGNFVVKTNSSGFLCSFLGSGVGLAVYDEIAGVGGMIHFLLSEPIGRSSARHPEHYARSGLDLLIAELVNSGALKQRLKASVAGGTLMPQPHDMTQDLGPGQMTTDLVLDLLAQQQIPLEKTAVGGLNPCSMLLDTANWKVTIELFSNKYQGSDIAPPAKPSAAILKKTISSVKPIPQVAVKITQLLAQETSSRFENLAEEIKRDQVMTSRVLLYCNSPAFGFSKNIASIDRAMVLLGEKNLFEIIISAAVNIIYTDQDKGYALLQNGLYKHALATAHVAKEIAIFTGGIDQGLAYTAGLLHDIGKIVLDGFVAESLPFFYLHLERQASDFCELESRLFDINHTQAGEQLAHLWNLPEPLPTAIRFHHTPEAAPRDQRMPVHVIYLADLLASHYLTGIEIERINTGDLETSLAAVGLRASQLPLIIDNIPWGKLMYS